MKSKPVPTVIDNKDGTWSTMDTKGKVVKRFFVEDHARIEISIYRDLVLAKGGMFVREFVDKAELWECIKVIMEERGIKV